MDQSSSPVKDSIKSLGIVFGDIGTSPLYTLSAIFAFSFLPVTLANVMGISSLIIWTLILLVTVQYAWLAMSLASQESGEGGITVLRETLIPLLKSPAAIVAATVLSFFGIALFIGDGVITPAITILSAVEGLRYVPLIGGITQKTVVIVTLIITFALFAFQKRGTDRVSQAFGPIMLIWFLFLAVSGIMFIVQYPAIFYAVNPLYAIRFFADHGVIGFLLLSKVILCATGGEALFQDMGHFGRVPTVRAWAFVFFCLVLVYLGQGAFLLSHPGAVSVFHEMILTGFGPLLYTPLVLLGITASIIASQALISGLFSLAYQCMTTHIMPRLHVEYTSQRFMSQIYIPLVNKLLFVLVVIVVVIFQSEKNLTSAYGLAANGIMTITAFLLTWIFTLRKDTVKACAAGLLVGVNLTFLAANTTKIPSGGYVSLLIACLPLSFIAIYTLGRKKLMGLLKQLPCETFVERFSALSGKMTHINGTAVFLCKSVDLIPLYVIKTMFTNNIVYEENIFVVMKTLSVPFGLTASFQDDLAPGLRVFEIRMGYLEIVDVDKIFNTEHIYPKVIFYGVEEIVTKNIFWRIFATIKKLTPSFVQFYKLPRNKLHGVLIRIEM